MPQAILHVVLKLALSLAVIMACGCCQFRGDGSVSARPIENPFPSVGEFLGYYNIPDDQYDDVGIPLRRSVEGVPELGFHEMLEVYKSAEKWFAEAIQPSSKRAFDPLAGDCFVPRDETNDRTLDIDNVEFSRLDVGFIRRIQREFLARYPLWRVVLDGEDASTGIVIYPNVIRFGDHPADVDPEEALRELVPRAIALRKARLRPRRNEIAYLRRQLPDAVRAIGERPYQVVGAVEDRNGKHERLTIRLLLRGSDQHAVRIEGPADAERGLIAGQNALGVNAMGAVISLETPEFVPFCVVIWRLPAGYRGPLTIVEKKTGKRDTYELNSENIIRAAAEE